VAVNAIAAATLGADWAPLPVDDRVAWLRNTVLLGTVAEVVMWLGTTWLPKPGRQLPNWSPPGMDFYGDLFESHPWLNGALTVTMLLSLLLCFVVPEALPVACGLLLAASLVDLWRFLYITYWLGSLWALCHEPESALVSLALIFGSLYFWAGFLKLTSPTFHQITAPFVFEPIFSRLGAVPVWLQRVVSHLSVGGEMTMGLVLLFSGSIPRWLLLGTACSNLGMHSYIVVGIGFRHEIETFVSWNCMCAAVAALLLTHPTPIPSLSMAACCWPHGVLLLMLWVPPLLQLIGRNDYPSLSHSWFVPGGVGHSTLIFARDAAQNMPRSDNGVAIRYYVDREAVAKAAALLGGPATMAAALELPLEEPITVEDLGNAVACINGSWVDWTFRLETEEHDPWNETFMAGPTSFWRRIVRQRLRAPAVHLRDRREALFLASVPDAAVCIPWPSDPEEGCGPTKGD